MLTTLDNTALKYFLKTSKDLIKRRKRIIVPRNYMINGKIINYKQAIIDIGIVKTDDIWNYVLDLKESECINVSIDYDHKRDFNSEMFEFIKNINGKDVYIKLTLRTSRNSDILVCLSFHESNRN